MLSYSNITLGSELVRINVDWINSNLSTEDKLCSHTHYLALASRVLTGCSRLKVELISMSSLYLRLTLTDKILRYHAVSHSPQKVNIFNNIGNLKFNWQG